MKKNLLLLIMSLSLVGCVSSPTSSLNPSPSSIQDNTSEEQVSVNQTTSEQQLSNTQTTSQQQLSNTQTTSEVELQEIKIEVKTSSTKIVVNPLDDAEYSLDGVHFVSNNVFSSLTPGETYVVYVRLKSNIDNVASKEVTLPLKDKMDIVILAGQSNALGISYMNEIGLNRTYNDIQIYCAGEDGNNTTNYNKWTTVKTGLGINQDAFGPEVGMSEILSPAYNDEEEYRNLAIVKYAWGGTAMWDWWLSSTSVAAGLGNTANINYQIDGKNVAWLYHNMITSVRNALTHFSNYDCSIIGMAWMQGESDATNITMTNNYETILTNFINDVRKDLSVPELPIYIGEISTRIAGYDDRIRLIQKNISDTIDNVDLVKTSDLEMGYLDWWHFTAQAQLNLGRRFGSMLLQHTGLNLEKVNDLDVTGYLNGKLSNVLYTTATFENNTLGYLPVTIEEDYSLSTVGKQVINGKVEFNGVDYDININVNVTNGALVDGNINDDLYKNATKHQVPMYLDIYANPLVNPQVSCSAEFKVATTSEGIYVSAELFDKQINNNFVNQQSFDWDLCLNNGMELYLDASGTASSNLTDKSAAIWLTSSDILRYYDSNGAGVYDGNNDYLNSNHKARQIVREVSINGTPNQNNDEDLSATFEIFVPYTVLGETDITKYRFALGFRTLHWFTEGFELPYGIYCNGAGNTFSNGNPSSWKPLIEVL